MNQLTLESLEKVLLGIWSMNESSTEKLSVRPNKLIVQGHLIKRALKILRGRGWHYKNTKRWRYLVKRGARR